MILLFMVYGLYTWDIYPFRDWRSHFPCIVVNVGERHNVLELLFPA